MTRERGHRKQQITRAALEIISEGGIRALTTGELAGRVGIVPSALYRHFPSLDDVILGAIGEMFTLARELFDEVSAGLDDPRDRLRAVLTVHTRMLQKSKAMPHILIASVGDPTKGTFRQALRGVQDGYFRMLSAVVADGQRRGLFRAELDPHLAAMQYFSIVVLANIRHLATDGEFDVEAFKDQSFETFIRGISVPDGVTGDNHA